MRIKIIKNRSDIGAGTRGSDMGIDAIEIAAINQGNDFFNRFPFIDVDTHNESVYNKVKNSFAKRIQYVLEQCIRVCNSVKNEIQNGFFPIVFSGDHSSALGTISGIKAAYPDKKLGVVWIDAHADLHSPYSSPSGNVHGMPLAAAIQEDNKKFDVNQTSNETASCWEKMKRIGIEKQKVMPKDIIYFGVRDTEKPEDHLIEKFEIKNYKVHEIRHRGMKECLDEVIETLDRCDIIYISFDVDSMDCDLISKGTGTPVSRGFDQYEVIEIIKRLFETNKVCCWEICEVNPLLDNKGNKMAETAFEVIDTIVKELKNK